MSGDDIRKEEQAFRRILSAGTYSAALRPRSPDYGDNGSWDCYAPPWTRQMAGAAQSVVPIMKMRDLSDTYPEAAEATPAICLAADWSAREIG
jgi:hypothetical protein